MDSSVNRKLLAKFHKDQENFSALIQNPLNSWMSQALIHMTVALFWAKFTSLTKLYTFLVGLQKWFAPVSLNKT